ncbi:hypothetical protein [Sphingobacterium hungaricum]
MSILSRLASSLNRKDEIPNQELAKEIIAQQNKDAVKELMDNLSNKNKDIQSDCIKVLYEIGAVDPSLIAGYTPEFVALLSSKNNRLQWGAMTALHAIATVKPAVIYHALPQIIAAADKGSVITNDQCVAILVQLASVPAYADDAFQLLIERLKKSPTNQLSMYAEQIFPIVSDSNRQLFAETLASRLPEVEKESKQKRIEKVIRKCNR